VRTPPSRPVPGDALSALAERIVGCTRCPELRSYCAGVARAPRASFREWTYWGRPVPGFGDPGARVWIVGLAPAAHGANRTGRVFTGDRSGDFLFAGLHRVGAANQPTSVSRDDGLALRGVWVGSSLRCAPPANRPTPEQLARCAEHLDAEWDALRGLRAIVGLGAIGWRAVLDAARRRGIDVPRPLPRFAHGAEVRLGDVTLVGCYHVSQQNTFTGRLTPPMLDAVLRRALVV
jgi:uracil-DNA glycosylase